MKTIRILGVLLLFTFGCSHGYHTDYCGCVPYQYRPPRPLPYGDDCRCDTLPTSHGLNYPPENHPAMPKSS